jgi:outer membrane biogenesis lipoprotein LolB
MMRLVMIAAALLFITACGADKEKMSRHNNTENILAPQQKQIDKAKKVEALLQDTAQDRYQDQ